MRFKLPPYGGYQFEYTGKYHVLSTPTLMLDWDIPEDAHIDKRCITIERREDAHDIMFEWVKDNPNYLFRVYHTLGGVRAFVLSHDYTWSTTRGLVVANHFMRYQMKCDELYIGLQIKKGIGWGARVSPKPNREYDWVAQYVLTIGKGFALPHHIVNTAMHDSLISAFV